MIQSVPLYDPEQHAPKEVKFGLPLNLRIRRLKDSPKLGFGRSKDSTRDGLEYSWFVTSGRDVESVSNPHIPKYYLDILDRAAR